MESTEQKLRRIYKDIIAKEKIEIHLKNIDRLILAKEAKLKEANVQLEKEAHDITRLERESLYNIFRALLGNTEQELEKECQEYLQVYLRKHLVSNLIDKITRIVRMLELEVEKTREYVGLERADLRSVVINGR